MLVTALPLTIRAYDNRDQSCENCPQNMATTLQGKAIALGLSMRNNSRRGAAGANDRTKRSGERPINLQQGQEKSRNRASRKARADENSVQFGQRSQKEVSEERLHQNLA